MGSVVAEKPHAVCIPYPAQGHITPMLQLAKLLHFRGFHITFVNTEYNHHRLLKSRGPESLMGVPDFRFETIPDGLPPTSDLEATQDIPSLCDSTQKNCLPHFRRLLAKLNQNPSTTTPSVTCIISDGIMSFTLDAAEELGIPDVLFWTPSACGFMCYLHYKELMERGLTPLKDVSDLSNGYLETHVDWIPGMKNMRLRDLPTFIRTTDPEDIMLNYAKDEAQRASRASAIILNTFYELEQAVLDGMKPMLPCKIYTIGPLSSLCNQLPKNHLTSLGSNLWKEDINCLDWLQGREPKSVVYVNFGSITVMSNQQMVEFAWGLANSNHAFLWVIRPDLVRGDSALLPDEFLTVTKERAMLASWCSQEQILTHPSIGGFLTHSGWNSTLESICGGVPMISWPFFSEQQTNCRFACTEWGIGMEIDNNVKREEVEVLIRELMVGVKGKEMRNKAVGWQRSAIAATKPGGDAHVNVDALINEFMYACNLSIGGFLTHSGWNSTLESICGGVPMISWPFFAEQQTNCRFACTEWGIGIEIDNDVKRDEVEVLIRELMEEEKGKEMRKKAVGWQRSAIATANPEGSSHVNLDALVDEVLLSSLEVKGT